MLSKFWALIFILPISYYAHKKITYFNKKYNLEKKHQTAIKRRAANKEKIKNYLKKFDIDPDVVKYITDLSFQDLLEKLDNGELKPSKVMLAFQKKSFLVNSELNCVVEYLPSRISEVNLHGPLKGIPISIKENFQTVNSYTYVGCSSFVEDEPFDEDCVPIKLLRHLGAIPFVKTLVPQTMFSTLSSNPIDGTCLNPLNFKRSPGGSSSGEASLIGSMGSILGFGGDIGGSIRIPSAMCGIVGFKPTLGRLSKKKMFNVTEKNLVSSSWGPMGRDVYTIKFVMREIFNSKYQTILDPTIPHVPWEKSVEEKKALKLGIFYDDGEHCPMPGVVRALKHVKKRLIENGHEVVNFQLPVTAKVWHRAFLKCIMADGGKQLMELLENDYKEPSINLWLKYLKRDPISKYLTKLKAYMRNRIDIVDKLEAQEGFDSVTSLVKFSKTVKEIQEMFIKAFQESGIDALLCPVIGLAAAYPLNPPTSFTYLLSYANLYNLVNFPAGSLPSGLYVNENDFRNLQYNADTAHVKMEDFNREVLLKLQNGTVGLPIGVQVASLPWQDEMCIRAMEVIEEVTKGSTNELVQDNDSMLTH